MTGVVRAGDRLVCVGERGIVLLSDDNGANWRQVISPVRVTLTSVFFIDAQRGWIVGHGGVVLGSKDGGEHWSLLLDGRREAALERDDAAANANVGDAAASRRLRDADSLVQDGPDKPLLDVRFWDPQHGLVVGAYGLAFATDDGGQNWHSLMGHIANPEGHYLYGIARSGQVIYLAGEQGSLFRSTDGGAMYMPVITGSKGPFFGVLTAGDRSVVAFGLRGNLFRSIDGGTSWTRLEMPTLSLAGGMRRADGSLLLVDEAGHVLRSTDAGAHFSDSGQSAAMSLSSVTEAKDGALVVAGSRGVTRLAPAGRAP